MKFLTWIALLLVVIGGLNWGLIGLLNFNVVTAVFGHMTFLARLIYVLVGLSAILVICTKFK